jgi:hypothetical protein
MAVAQVGEQREHLHDAGKNAEGGRGELIPTAARGNSQPVQ